jgi:outer membrane lipoprotein-sorting protein
MFPYSIESGPKNNPSVRAKVTIESIETNVPIDDSAFKMPNPPVKGS